MKLFNVTNNIVGIAAAIVFSGVVTASAERPWPGTDQKLTLVCRVVLPDEKYGSNEFLDKNGRVCRWVVEVKNDRPN